MKELSGSTTLNNLPKQLLPMVGREKEIAEISGMLQNPDIRSITLYGFGGSGKTRLAVEIGQKTMGLYPDGVWFVALAPLKSAEMMLSATASAVGFTFSSPTDQKNQLQHYLQGKNLLFIFDNLEHLLPEGAAFLEEILQTAPQVCMLITSRQPLNAPWEWAYALRGLDPEMPPSSMGEMPAAAKLFIQHLRQQGQPVKEGSVDCAIRIGQMVNGLPLAILLAASWGRTLGCDEIVAEIQRGIGFLQSRQLFLPDRQRSMQAVFDYSWQLLSDREQAALRKLSVFQGGFDRDAAHGVAGAHLSILATLVDQSLVERVANDRYQIHEMLRQYLQTYLTEAGEDQSARDAHLAYYTELSERAEPELVREQQLVWIDRLNGEIDNMRAALEWGLLKPDAEMGLRLLVAAERLWILPPYTKTGMSYLLRFLPLVSKNQEQHLYVRGLNLAGWLAYLLEELPESRRFTAQALQVGLLLNDKRLVGETYYVQCMEAFYRKDHKAAQIYAQKSLDSYEDASDAHGKLLVLEYLGRCAIYLNDFSAGEQYLTAALDLVKKLGDVRVRYSILRGLGELGMIGAKFRPEQSRAFIEEGLAVARQFKDQFYISHSINSLGEIARTQGQFEQAAQYYEQAIIIDQELGQQDEVILHGGNLGFVYAHLGKINESKHLFLKNLDLALKSDHLSIEITTSLLGLASVAVLQGDAQQAAILLGAIDAVKEPLLLSPSERGDYERTLTSAKAQLTGYEYDEYFKKGIAAGQTQAAKDILNPASKEIGLKTGRLNDLTPREIEILRLVAMGLSDQEVARQLVISPRTVNAHLTSIFGKLDVNSRAAAARFARDKGLE